MGKTIGTVWKLKNNKSNKLSYRRLCPDTLLGFDVVEVGSTLGRLVGFPIPRAFSDDEFGRRLEFLGLLPDGLFGDPVVKVYPTIGRLVLSPQRVSLERTARTACIASALCTDGAASIASGWRTEGCRRCTDGVCGV